MFDKISERDLSFSIGINLISTKNKKYVVLKPFITISSFDLKVLTKIGATFDEKVRVRKRDVLNKRKPDHLYITIQHPEKARKFVELTVSHKFSSSFREKTFRDFKKALEIIEDIGYIKTEWDDKISRLLELKMSMNDSYYNKPRISRSEWEKKIKAHIL